MFDVDGTVSSGPERSAVESMRFGGTALLLPEQLAASGWWGIYGSLRTAAVRFERSADPQDTTPGGLLLANVEPALGMVLDYPTDDMRFEVDVAPVFSAGKSTRVASQASLAAALATAPHDDLLFLPNLNSAGRLRVALTRRWDFCPLVSASVGTEVKAGYAQTATVYGATQGTAGGALFDIRVYFRPRFTYLEGIYLDGKVDLGYTSAWSSDVVLPMRFAAGLGVALTRTVEVQAEVARFASSIVLGGIDSTGTTLAVRWSFDRSAPETWRQRHEDLMPTLKAE